MNEKQLKFFYSSGFIMRTKLLIALTLTFYFLPIFLFADDLWGTITYPAECTGLVTCVKAAPSGRLYIGTNGLGIYFSDDSGLNWSNIIAQEMVSIPIKNILID